MTKIILKFACVSKHFIFKKVQPEMYLNIEAEKASFSGITAISNPSN